VLALFFTYLSPGHGLKRKNAFIMGYSMQISPILRIYFRLLKMLYENRTRA
jgi:hypothetical protein